VTVPALSVVIPALDEATTIGGLLGDLSALRVTHEVIVSDGGSRDATPRAAGNAGAFVVRSERGRGRQLRAGIAAARGAMLCVLHADVRLPAETLRALEQIGETGARGAWAFRLRIDARGAAYRLVELGANLRSRAFALPYGDQGLVLDRATYDDAGGYADVPLMEDVLLARALRRAGRRIVLRREAVVVCARRWERDGVLRRSGRNLLLLARLAAGASPDELAPRYDARR
jgi:rSAM/selenodomain-associated transferase 2